mmetsp:Transcript_48717/g.136292  ORF Transcript_48717/g.136292 Transcript_48717/m.136292 type:complete len:204 (+) Transcript_48717:47-658(+)
MVQFSFTAPRRMPREHRRLLLFVLLGTLVQQWCCLQTIGSAGSPEQRACFTRVVASFVGRGLASVDHLTVGRRSRSKSPLGIAIAAALDNHGWLEEVSGIKLERKLAEHRCNELGISTWALWESDATMAVTWPVTYSDPEAVYILEGDVQVSPQDGGPGVSFGAGDMASFPPGACYIWAAQGKVRLRRGIVAQNGRIVPPLSW